MEEVKKVRSFNWEPECFKNEAGEPKYTGHLVIKSLPSYERNQQMLDESASRPKGDDVQDTALAGGWMLGIWSKYRHMVLSAEVVRVKDNVKLDLDDVLHEEGLIRLPLEFAGKILGGFGLGNG